MQLWYGKPLSDTVIVGSGPSSRLRGSLRSDDEDMDVKIKKTAKCGSRDCSENFDFRTQVSTQHSGMVKNQLDAKGIYKFYEIYFLWNQNDDFIFSL